MVTPISGDGVFSHVTLGSNDIGASSAFYDAVLAPLDIKNLGPFGSGWVLYGRDKPAFILVPAGNGKPASSNGVTIGFAATSRDVVDAFHKAGLGADGTDEGAPGPRDHLPNAYAAYLRDPSGNKICAYCFEPE